MDLKMTYDQRIENNICPFCKNTLVKKLIMGEKKKRCTGCDLEYDDFD